MHIHSIAKATSAVVACGGLAVAISAAALGSESTYRDLLIVGGVDGFTIGCAAFILLLIFFNEKPASSPLNMDPLMRSLDNPEGHELKRMLVRHVSREKPVTIGFPADDPEAQRFAGQIGRFLHKNSFKVVGFAAELPTVRLDPGIGIDESNHILVGPIEAPAPSPASTKSPLPAAFASNDGFRPEMRVSAEAFDRVD